MAYLPGVGVDNLAVRSAPTLFNSPFYWTNFDRFLLTVLNISSILIIEHLFAFTKGCE